MFVEIENMHFWIDTFEGIQMSLSSIFSIPVRDENLSCPAIDTESNHGYAYLWVNAIGRRCCLQKKRYSEYLSFLHQRMFSFHNGLWKSAVALKMKGLIRVFIIYYL